MRARSDPVTAMNSSPFLARRRQRPGQRLAVMICSLKPLSGLSRPVEPLRLDEEGAVEAGAIVLHRHRRGELDELGFGEVLRGQRLCPTTAQTQ